jgi:uncharacterized protein YqgV (UPF0045/DUF77 family)
MTTQKLIESELGNLSEEQLNQVYEVIKKLHDYPKNPAKSNLMTQLKQIEIDAPQDFSVTIAREIAREVGE